MVVQVVGITGDKIRIGVHADKTVPIDRKEVWDKKHKEVQQ